MISQLNPCPLAVKVPASFVYQCISDVKLRQYPKLMYYSEQMASDIPIEIYGSPCQSVHGNIGHRPGSQVRQDAHFSHNFLS